MSLYSLNPIEFEEADRQLTEQETRREWAYLHGEFATPHLDKLYTALCGNHHGDAMTWENDIERANRRIMELEAEVELLKGGLHYLETVKIPWIERELDRKRSRLNLWDERP